ncbi:MAG: D-aminoacylase [Anaerolineae bacterium]|nr:D-aminoacylase [Anaerolineae bacterium]
MTDYDIIIRGGTVYDGYGGAPFAGDVAITGDAIAAVAPHIDGAARAEIDAHGLAAAPGFINMLSWSVWSLVEDGCAQSVIRQGVTLEVMGEDMSMGPVLDDVAEEVVLNMRGDLRHHAIEWTTLGEYLEYLAARGVAPNVASFVGVGTVRANVIGLDNRAPSTTELDHMCALVRHAMEEGAMGLASALIYIPSCFTSTEELIALARVAAESGGLYISHLRSEEDRFLEALDELLTIARAANIRAEIYHLKAAGRANWHKLDAAIAKVEAARAEGLQITADMYTYPASQTGLDASLPQWVREGGLDAMVARLQDPAMRERAKQEIAPMGESSLLVGFESEALKPLTGKPLSEIAAARGRSPEDTMIDLIVEDHSRISTVYFSMSEENVRKKVALPWVSFGSDGEAIAAEGVFLRSSTHPRTYGNFARLLAKYVREEQIIPLEEAVRRLTTLPAATLKLDRRGALQAGHFADVVVFDPATVQDHATFENPHQYSTGVHHVLVNGVPVLRDGEHTGATPGRVVRGPGWRGG